MKPSEIKELLTSRSVYNFLKYKFREKKKCKFSYDLNFQKRFKNKGRFYNETSKTILNKQLVVTGLNWKFIKAADIYFILKPFEGHLGGIRKVSIFAYNSILKKKKYLHRNELKFSDSIHKTKQVRGSIFQKDKKIFAHIECDSEETMIYLFNQCNGLEIGVENQIIDMRIVDFKSRKKLLLMESVKEIPNNYKPGYLRSDFHDNKKNLVKKKNRKDKFLLHKMEGKDFKIKLQIYNEKFNPHASEVFYFYKLIKDNSFFNFKSNIFLTGEKVLPGKLISKKKL